MKEKTGLPISNQWILSRFDDHDSVKVVSKKAFITIDEKESTFRGNGSCNSIGGNVNISGNRIKFDRIISTRMYCQDLSEQEQKFLDALRSADNFKIIGCELFLYQDDRQVLVLESCR